jgi:carnitine O-acetyltransferase
MQSMIVGTERDRAICRVQLSEWWLNLAYLHLRLPLPVWSSPGILLPLQDCETLDDQLRLAAKVITGIVDYKTLIDR